MIDPALPDRLSTLLPGVWQPCPQGYAIATPAGLLTVRTPYGQYLVRLNEGDTLKTYAATDLPALIRRALGAELFDALTDPTNTIKAERNRRRAELNHARQMAEAALNQAEDALAAIEAQIADLDRENPA